MRPFEKRGLSAGEIALGRGIFGDELDWPRLRVVQLPLLGFGAMAPLSFSVLFSQWRAACDFAEAGLNEQGWFLHELTHVWQSASGRVVPLAKLHAMGKRAYQVAPKRGDSFAAHNIEAQAEIVRMLFLARADAAPAGAPSRDWLEKAWKSRPKIRSRSPKVPRA